MSRLIDADALMEASKYEFWQDVSAITPIGEYILKKFRQLIRNTPTVTPEPKWIPCSDAPDTDRNVFIARGEKEKMTVCIGYYDHDYKQWYEDRNWFAKCLYDGLYWCEMPPLPEPYREEGE